MLLVTGQGVLDLFLCLQTTNLIIKQCAFSFVKLKETGLPIYCHTSIWGAIRLE